MTLRIGVNFMDFHVAKNKTVIRFGRLNIG